MNALPPIHPGEVIREDILPELRLTITEAAKLLKCSRKHLHEITREENPKPISPAMALKLGKLFGNGPRIWLNMQAAYDLKRLEIEMIDELNSIETFSAA